MLRRRDLGETTLSLIGIFGCTRYCASHTTDELSFSYHFITFIICINGQGKHRVSYGQGWTNTYYLKLSLEKTGARRRDVSEMDVRFD